MAILTTSEALAELHLDSDAGGVVAGMLPTIDAEIEAATGYDWSAADADALGLSLAKGAARLKLRIWYFALTDPTLNSQLTAKIKGLQAYALAVDGNADSQ